MLILLAVILLFVFLIIYFNKHTKVFIATTSFIFIFQNQFIKYVNFLLIERPIVFRVTDVFLVIMLILLIKRIYDNPKRILMYLQQNKLINLFFLYIIIQSIFSFGKYGLATLAELRFKYFFIVFILYTVMSVKSLEEQYKMLKVLVNISLSFILFIPIIWAIQGAISYINRPINSYTYMAIVIAYFQFLYIKKYNKKKYNKKDYDKVKTIVLTIILIMVSFFANHRSVWAAILVLLIFFTIYGGVNRFKILVIGFYLFLFLVLMFPSEIFFVAQRAHGIINPEADATGYWRILIWKSIVQEIIYKAHYLGMGLGHRFEVYVPELREYLSYGTHNEYFTILYYNGIPGLLLFIVFMVLQLKEFIALSRINKEIIKKIIYMSGAIALLGNLVYMASYETGFTAWFYVGIAISSKITYKQISYKVRSHNEDNYYYSST